MNAHFINAEDFRLDGVLDEDFWNKTQKISNFTQRELSLGDPMTERTEVAVVYAKSAIYIGVWCYDSKPEGIVAKEFRRDFNVNLEDNFKIIIDTYGDKRNGFLFIINPLGARADFQVFNNGGSVDPYWNGVWDVRTKITSEGWFAEIEIPIITLKFRDNRDEQIWGINFERNIQRKREQAFWQGWSRDARIEQVNRAGVLTGLNELRSATYLEVKPYALLGVEDRAGQVKPSYNFGGDINYTISPTFRLNSTFNTDFAQVESDRLQINLERFPLFFPELREFFLEGQDFFDMGFGGNRIIPFYTRNIGLDAERRPVPIIAGARMLGKENNATIGAMSIQTAATENEMGTNYSAFSWRQDVLSESTVGFMSVNKITSTGWHTTTGGNFRYTTSKLFGNKNMNFGGAYIRTYNNSVGAMKGSYAYRTFLSYPNDKFSVFASMQQSPANFEPEVGLMRRRDFREFYLNTEFKPRPKSTGAFSWIRQFVFKPGELTYTLYNQTGAMQTFFYKATPLGISTKSGENLSFNLIRQAEGLDSDFAIRPDVNIAQGNYWFNRYDIYFQSFRSRTFSVETFFAGGEFYNGEAENFYFEGRLRANKYLSFSSTYQYNNVRLPQGSFETIQIGLRTDYAFSPTTFGLIYGQWNNDLEEVVFNFRFQWIPKIGSDFFFIVNQNIDTSGRTWRAINTTVLGKFIWRFIL